MQTASGGGFLNSLLVVREGRGSGIFGNSPGSLTAHKNARSVAEGRAGVCYE